MSFSDEAWYDDDAGPLVRLYARVGGHAPVLRDGLGMSALVHCPAEVLEPDGLTPDQQTALRLARRPIALSELAVHLGLPLGPARLLLGELREMGLVEVRQRDASPAVLERLLSGLHSL
jgi:DNA-binding IclR family transcriptional regulator